MVVRSRLIMPPHQVLTGCLHILPVLVDDLCDPFFPDKVMKSAELRSRKITHIFTATNSDSIRIRGSPRVWEIMFVRFLSSPGSPRRTPEAVRAG